MVKKSLLNVFVSLLAFTYVVYAFLFFRQFILDHQHDFYPSNFPAPLASSAVNEWVPFLAALCLAFGFLLFTLFQRTRKVRYQSIYFIFLALLLPAWLITTSFQMGLLRDHVLICAYFLAAGNLISLINFPMDQASHD